MTEIAELIAPAKPGPAEVLRTTDHIRRADPTRSTGSSAPAGSISIDNLRPSSSGSTWDPPGT